jgi:voltage-dependent calcium channel L type alpha-1D
MFIMLCIITNTVVLAVQLYQMDPDTVEDFDYFNYAFIVIFTLEAILKITAMRSLYFKDNWNKFDFSVVITTFVVLIIKYIPGLQLDLSTQATIVRVLRVLRILRIVKRAEKLQIIFQTVLDAIPSMASLGVLLLLFLFLFAVIGMQLFSFVKLQGDLNR